MNLKEEVSKRFKGEVHDETAVLDEYSHDASLFVVRPKLVVYPEDKEDLKAIVKFISDKKSENPSLSLAIRAAGSCMSGGSLTESIVADVSKKMHKIGEVGEVTEVEPGAYYRDFEKKTLEKGLILPCYTASKNLCAIGGMIGNNAAGERTLRYGQMHEFVEELDVVLRDGEEHTFNKLNMSELEEKKRGEGLEAEIYKGMHDLLEKNYDVVKSAKPAVSKNSAGYLLWNIYDREKGTFDLSELITGSQGTLGVVTNAKLRLMKDKKHHDMVALFFKSWDDMPSVVNAILPHKPESLETFDSDTLKLGIRFMPEIAKKAGSSLAGFAAKFLPEVLIGARMLGLPKLIILVEISEDSKEEVRVKVDKIVEAIKPFKVWHRVIEDNSEEEKFWIMRRESFSLLRKHVKGKRTAPFIDDFCIPAERVPEFLPRALKILKSEGISANIAGHAGNGNFHIIPLMDFTRESERAKIPRVSEKFYNLVAEYKGTISGEHNDGLVRTPYLGKMYSPEVLELFRQVKKIFDPENIFNPGKKVPVEPVGPGTVEYMTTHMAHK